MPAIAVAAIGAGASLYGASQASKAANKATAAQTAASQQQLAQQQAAFDRITQLNQPFITGGQSAFQTLLQQVNGQQAQAPAPNLSYDAAGNTVQAPTAAPSSAVSPLTAVSNPGPGNAVTQQAPAPIAQPDYAAYVQNNPDLQAEFARLQSDPATAAQFPTAEAYGQYHAQTFGDRAVPTAQPQQAQAPAPVDPNAAPNLMNAARPDAAAAPTSVRPDAMTAPASFSYTPQDIENDAGYQFARNEGLAGVNAASAVSGKLRSGDAAKALQTRGSGIAHQWDNDYFNRALSTFNANTQAYQYGQNRSDNVFQNDRAYDTALWQTGVNRGDTNFNTDRAYQTNRADTQTGNLFSLAQTGQQAAGAVGSAGQAYANNAGNIYGSQANAAADAANAKAAANSQLAGSLAGIGSNLFANYGGQPATQAAAAVPFNQNAYRSWVGGAW